MGGARESITTSVLIPWQWAEATKTIVGSDSTMPPITLICGPKNSGKSTFSRYLLNTLLLRYKRVGYLDTDVGQPEFGLPGCLSFHIIDECISDLSSPSIRAPERCLFFGDISSKRDPQAYLNYIFRLYDHFVKEHRQSSEIDNFGKSMLPLIINTPGWVKGIGYDLLVDILRYTSPTQVVQIRISVESKNLPSGAFWLDEEQKGSIELIEIPSARKDSSNRSEGTTGKLLQPQMLDNSYLNGSNSGLSGIPPFYKLIETNYLKLMAFRVLIQKDARGLRDRCLFEYFKQCFPSNLNIISNKELAYALASLPPYEVSFSGIKVLHLHCQVPSNEIFHSLNATIVGLAVSSGGSMMLQCSSPWCVGLGIVRGVDITKGLLYVITPVPCSKLENVDLLLQGFIEIPIGLLQARGCTSPYMSTNVLHRLPEKVLREIMAE